jgi:DNA polymerase-3 subunit epsilon/CBS domain-containing protein
MSFALPDPSHGALPLRSLAAVVLDCETTGLDARTDRVVELGAVRLGAGLIETESFEALVNPGRPIPPQASAIHGIQDAAVAAAPAFATVMPELAAFAGARVVLGYAIGFDLAVLQAEHGRAGLAWRAPRSLCVRQLAQLLAPPLPSLELATLAAWLGVTVGTRHRALADARLAAELFLAILPRLEAAGLRSLAETERACRALHGPRAQEAQAGWHEVAAALDAAGVEGTARIDSFPYRHRLRALMRQPPVLAAAATPLRDALARMMAERVSSVLVPPAAAGEAYGILTERDVLRALVESGAAALAQPIGRHASRPLISLDQDELAYRAIRQMAARGIRHLGVHDSQGALVGALSARDLLKQRAAAAITLGETIEQARNAAELGRIWAGLAAVAATLLQEQVEAAEIALIISDELRALTRRAAELAEAELAEAGLGGPPAPYALMVLGSGGRGESLLAMDQDNAIVYEAGAPAGAERWFEALGQCLAAILNAAGVAFCKGGVMASNPAWRMDEARWRQTVAGWLRQRRPEDILHADIFFDGRPVHGALTLGEALHRDALAAAGQAPDFLRLLAIQAATFEAPFNWLGRLRLEAGRVDLKKGGLMALVATTRVLALRHGIAARSTRARLEAARPQLARGAEAIGPLLDAHTILLAAILGQQLRDLGQGIPLSNRVRPADLSARQRQDLTWALDQLVLAADLLGMPLAF